MAGDTGRRATPPPTNDHGEFDDFGPVALVETVQVLPEQRVPAQRIEGRHARDDRGGRASPLAPTLQDWRRPTKINMRARARQNRPRESSRGLGDYR